MELRNINNESVTLYNIVIHNIIMSVNYYCYSCHRLRLSFFNDSDIIRSSTLEISSLQSKDTGWYYCIAQNKYGSHVIRKHLIVLEPPQPPRQLQTTEVTPRSFKIAWKTERQDPPLLGHFVSVRSNRDLTNGSKNSEFHAREIFLNSTISEEEFEKEMFSVDHLRPGSEYKVKIRAVNEVGRGSWSDDVVVVTPEEGLKTMSH